MKAVPTDINNGAGMEKTQHVMNLLIKGWGVKKVPRIAVLTGTVSAKTTPKLAGVEPINESGNIERVTRNNRKYPALNAHVSNSGRKKFRSSRSS
jgi:hypothetical protein